MGSPGRNAAHIVAAIEKARVTAEKKQRHDNAVAKRSEVLSRE